MWEMFISPADQGGFGQRPPRTSTNSSTAKAEGRSKGKHPTPFIPPRRECPAEEDPLIPLRWWKLILPGKLPSFLWVAMVAVGMMMPG
ncbi:hypothetical protein E2C01_041141 [Portunus trituberculatus]|uniref:Uncharacterized protein n=1 Tax=Portunus trituberculatus TaxID=210409 RepID=A0A5B7FPL5_PORTR|nr:hypothetical protein [Portunus trituberculatus]